MIFISIRHTARSSQNTGIQRVVRGFARFAVEQPEVKLVEWRNWRGAFYEPMPEVSRGIGRFGGPDIHETPLMLPMPKSIQDLIPWGRYGGMRRRTPLHRHPVYRNREGWLILPELMTAEMMKESIQYGKAMGLKVAVILYDCIAYFHPEWVNERIRENHRGYLNAVADADLVIPISVTSGVEYERFLKEEGRSGAVSRPVYLAEEFLGIPAGKVKNEAFGADKIWKMLYVSTLDPRKNHLGLLEGLKIVEQKAPELKWQLTFVGHPYEGAPEIEKRVQEEFQKNLKIVWKQGVSDQELASLYEEADFTLFPSFTEGFGLPIAESLWRGRPCLCSGIGSMHEIAEKGGCLEIDPFSSESIANGVIEMMRNPDLFKELQWEIVQRKFKTWENYSNEVLGLLERK